MKKILFFILSLYICGNVSAQTAPLHVGENDSISLADGDPAAFSVVQQTFSKAMADSAYMANDYATAIEIYENLLKDGEAAEVFYNLGNSYFKSDDISRAILNYERALLLNPGNEDIKANLQIARNKTVDKVDSVPDIFFVGWIKSLISGTTADTWGIWGIAFFVLFLVSLYFFIFSKSILWKKIGFVGGVLFLVFVVLTNVFASYQKETLLNKDKAIVISPSVTIRSTPTDSGTSLFILHEGHKVSIKDNSMREWKEISLEDGKVGWIPASAIEVI